jgi:predicted RNA-binding protein
MHRNWFCVTNPLNWLIVRREHVWGVDYRYEKTIKQRVSEGDMLAFYVLKSMRKGLKSHAKMLDETQRRELQVARGCFVGIWRVSGPYFEDQTHIEWLDRDGRPEGYPHRREISLEMQPATPTPLSPESELFQELVFITDNTRSWHNALYSSMSLLSEEDLLVFKRFCK